MIWPRGVSHDTPPGQIARVVPRVYILAAGRGCLERRATRSGDPQQAKNKESDTPFAQRVLGGGLRAPLPRRGQGLRAKEDKNSSRTHKFCHFFSCCARSAGSIERALGKDARSRWPCSRRLSSRFLDVERRPFLGARCREGAPHSFLSPPLLFSSSFLQSRNYARFFAMMFWVDMKGLSPRRPLR